MADESPRRCGRCGWEGLGGPACPRPHPKRTRRVAAVEPRLLRPVLTPVDPVLVRAYRAACTAKGYGAGVPTGNLGGDIATVLARLREQAGISEPLPQWVTESADA